MEEGIDLTESDEAELAFQLARRLRYRVRSRNALSESTVKAGWRDINQGPATAILSRVSARTFASSILRSSALLDKEVMEALLDSNISPSTATHVESEMSSFASAQALMRLASNKSQLRPSSILRWKSTSLSKPLTSSVQM